VFSVKANRSPDIILNADVHDDNVYTRCLDCDEELQADLKSRFIMVKLTSMNLKAVA